VTFRHYDLYAQALAKLERGHDQDLRDVREMVARRLVELKKLLQFYGEIEPRLHQYPAIHAPAFRRAVEEFVRKAGGETPAPEVDDSAR
jgi:hypothetical protein